ncbi:DNA-binding transcriptional regulator LysR [compost metagenome]
MIPTAEGEAFYADVERAFVGLESLGESADSIRRRGTGLLRVGAVGSIEQCVLPDAIQMFRRMFPDIPVVVNMGRSDVVAKWTATGFCDVGFCSTITDLASLDYELINTARGVVIVNSSHRLATHDVVYPSDFVNEHFISLPMGSSNRSQIDRHFPNDMRHLSIETPYASTICTMVSKGLGTSIVSPIVSGALRVKNVSEIPFSEEIEFNSYAVTSDHFPMGFLANRLTECVRRSFEALRQSKG